MRWKRTRGNGFLRQLYSEAQLPDFARKGLNWILAANLCGNLHGIICGGGTATMVGLAGLLGAGDFEFGLLVAIPQIAALLQIPFSVLVNRTHRRKIYILTLGLFGRLLWLLFGFLPLLGGVADSRLPLYTLIVLLGISSSCLSVVNVTWFPWFSDLAPLSIRGRWLSNRDMINGLLGLGFGLLVAWLLDTLGVESRYIVTFLIGGALGAMDMICFGFVKEVWSAEPVKTNVMKTFAGVLKNKPFMKITMMWTAWCFTANMSGSYLTPYAMNVMGLNFFQVTLFGTVAASLATVVMVPRWGQAVDTFGSRTVMLLSGIGASLTPLFFLMSRPGSIWPMLLHNLIGAFFWCGSNLAANSFQLFASPDGERSTYIAFFACICSLVGTALGTLCGGWFLDYCHTSGLFTGSFDRYKVLILISVVLRFMAVILMVPRLENENGETPSSLMNALMRRVHVPKRTRR